jgi:hypothetical protein
VWLPCSVSVAYLENEFFDTDPIRSVIMIRTVD